MKITLTLTPEQVELFSKTSLPVGLYTGRQMLAATLIIEALERAAKKNIKGNDVVGFLYIDTKKSIDSLLNEGFTKQEISAALESDGKK